MQIYIVHIIFFFFFFFSTQSIIMLFCWQFGPGKKTTPNKRALKTAYTPAISRWKNGHIYSRCSVFQLSTVCQYRCSDSMKLVNGACKLIPKCRQISTRTCTCCVPFILVRLNYAAHGANRAHRTNFRERFWRASGFQFTDSRFICICEHAEEIYVCSTHTRTHVRCGFRMMAMCNLYIRHV